MEAMDLEAGEEPRPRRVPDQEVEGSSSRQFAEQGKRVGVLGRHGHGQPNMRSSGGTGGKGGGG